jgi:hypothetical protein
MSAKRPAIDLMSLTSEQATPMAEAVQRMAPPAVVPAPKTAPKPAVVKASAPVEAGREFTANLEGLSFKVPPEFRRRFRQRAADEDLKLNELLFAAFDAWEKQHPARKS